MGRLRLSCKGIREPRLGKCSDSRLFCIHTDFGTCVCRTGRTPKFKTMEEDVIYTKLLTVTSIVALLIACSGSSSSTGPTYEQLSSAKESPLEPESSSSQKHVLESSSSIGTVTLKDVCDAAINVIKEYPYESLLAACTDLLALLSDSDILTDGEKYSCLDYAGCDALKNTSSPTVPSSSASTNQCCSMGNAFAGFSDDYKIRSCSAYKAQQYIQYQSCDCSCAY